jgi:hypothetical protein
LVLGEPLPEEVVILPTSEVLTEQWNTGSPTPRTTVPPPTTTGFEGDRNTVGGVLGGTVPPSAIHGSEAELPEEPADDDLEANIDFAEIEEANQSLTERTGSHMHTLDDAIAEAFRLREEDDW